MFNIFEHQLKIKRKESKEKGHLMFAILEGKEKEIKTDEKKSTDDDT